MMESKRDVAACLFLLDLHHGGINWFCSLQMGGGWYGASRSRHDSEDQEDRGETFGANWHIHSKDCHTQAFSIGGFVVHILSDLVLCDSEGSMIPFHNPDLPWVFYWCLKEF